MKFLIVGLIIVIIQIAIITLDLLFPSAPLFSWSTPIIAFGCGIIWGLALEVAGWVDT